MSAFEHLPMSGILLAAIAAIAMVATGVDPLMTLAVIAVWVGSLYLAASRPPPAQEAARDSAFSRDQMRDLIEHSSTPLLVTNRDRITLANAAARTLLGTHIINQDVRVAFRKPKAVKLLSRKKDGSTIVKGLVRRQDIWRINKQQVDHDMSVVELVNLTAEADISRAHTDFVANASHELRTPLASIIGYVETLRDDGENLEPETSARFLDTILREAKRLQDLVSDLMSLSRVEAEKHEEPSELIEFAKLIERASSDAAGVDRKLRIEFDLDKSIVVRGDSKQLEQLTRNLVDNALKYGNPNEPVSVVLNHSPDGQARLCVTDRGEGIAAEHLPHLTRRFFRTDPGRSRASGGTGLGLAIVKHIVERHRGRLDIESEVGKGTSVLVRFPAVEKQNELAS